ncbi:MAG: hotdog fold thioesterase [Cyclobacteriaceae bacterium]|nr:hotdog fold thioesterase [Cyclobacteriaceae bacterium]MCH8515749.1 hotdog fold thioesterase [Cyclobacteriaceae bacterium]
MQKKVFPENVSLDRLNQMSKNTMVEHLGIEYVEITDYSLRAKMPVDHRTVQPFRLLHGGASVVLAETLGSVAANIYLNDNTKQCVGLEINANHLKSAHEGEVVEGVTQPLHLGRATQVWEIKIYNAKQELLCVSRITMAVKDIRN